MEAMLEILTDNLFTIVVATCFLATIVLNAVTRIVTTASRERSRREIAAYIAEGSIAPDQGERLLRVDVNRGPART